MNKYISLAVIATCVTFSACNNEKAAESTENTTPSVSESTTATPEDTTTVAETTPTTESNLDATTTTVTAVAKTETTKAPSTRVINGKAYTAKQLEQAIKTDENLAFDVAMKQQADPQFQIWYDEGTNAMEKIDAQLAQSTAEYNKAKAEADKAKAEADKAKALSDDIEKALGEK